MAQWSKFIGRGAVMNFGNHKRAILCPERQVSTPARAVGALSRALSIILRLWIVSASWFILYYDVSSVSARAAGALTFVVCDKSKQKHALPQRFERSHNHRQSFVLSFLLYNFCSPFPLFSVSTYR